MKKALRLVASILLLAAALDARAYGWGNGGHMAVAAVAYDRMTTQARARADTLVSLNPRFGIWQNMVPQNASPFNRRKMLFMIAATWADQIKGDGQHFADGPDGGNTPPNDGTAAQNIGYTDRAMRKYWHFIDLPFTQEPGTPLINPPVPNALTQINTFRMVLASNAPDHLKSFDLVWLLHLVGDVHQPLHCAARFGQDHPRGDEGGNLVRVCDPQCGERLHGFWDGLFGSSPLPGPALALANSLPAAPPALANNLHTATWINEGLANAQATVYRNPIRLGRGPFTITQAYRNSARALGRQRIALAGARLARVLNNDLR